MPGLAADLELKRTGARSDDAEEEAERELLEGARYAVVLDRVERSRAARRKCLEHFGPVCAVCEMRFSEVYSGVQDRTIAVHHLRPIASSKGARVVDPVKDLRPVCHNCHAVLHSRRPEPLSLEQAKARLRRARSQR